MKSIVLLFATAFVLISTLVEISEADAPEKSCKAFLADLTKRQLGGIANCGKSMTFKNGKDKAAKMNCILKCVMINEGLLQAPGLATDEVFEAFVKKEIPPSMVAVSGAAFINCQKTHGGSVDPSDKDEFCKSYDPFIKCLMGVIASLCPK